ncbi:Protein N-acetyltransferase, RimJ/RimL family [Pilibacter termitis]|uniref:Protein N-acetyltransferase, RimJ/RimL family n=1 Tax=Pilibacter termitis TaxID=263852 RepID=A0A1T4PU20_9ENTE|nr:GNAT family protein [Pilibacter termitis]SJZ94806.1 Protein N-acetyltransferase, RimJ/RimL family [Pilibacter termitis]
MYFKKLVGENCFLSPIDVNDAELFTSWLNDLEIVENLGFPNLMITVESERTMLEELAKEHNYAIIDQKTNQCIGNCGFKYVDLLNKTAEVGIFIGNRDFWNRGYGQEALKLLIDYGFQSLNLHSVYLKVFSYNTRAIRCYEKIGFKEIGRRRESLLRGEVWHDIILMDILVGEVS